MKKKIIGILLYTLPLLGLLACSDFEEETTKPQDEGAPSVEVPIRIELETAWNIDADGAPGHRYAPPPGAGSGNAGGGGTSTISDGWVDGYVDVAGVDKVRIIAFKRKDTSDGTGTSEPFRYDATNDKVLDKTGEYDGRTDNYTTSHKHPYWEGTLTKTFGFEYRVVAIAYNSTRAVPYASNGSYNGVLTAGEQNWFTLNLADGLTLENFMATITTQLTEDSSTGWREYLTGNSGAVGALENTDNLTRRVMASPQLFWAELYLADATLEEADSPIIRFQATTSTGDLVQNAALTGLLYRGMAKIELHINLERRDKGAGTQNVEWLALMADHLQTQVRLSAYDDFLTPFTPVQDDGKFTAIDFITSSSAGTKVLTAWILPTRTRLAIRGQYQLALGAHRVDNGQLCADNISYGDMGTGIIAADVVDNYFTFRRNHKYVLNCSSSEAIFDNHEIN